MMRNTLYFIAFLLIIGWASGYLGYAEGGLIYLILVISILILAMKMMLGENHLKKI